MAHAYIDGYATGQRRVKHKEWVSAYGILQSVETVTLDEDGKQTANSRSSARIKELPGGSPAMLPWLLNRSVFLSLGDMGFPLPEYTEIPVSVPMAPEQETLYESLKEQLKEELKERLVRGDKSLLAGYLYALLFWPDSPRRGMVVTCPRDGKVVASIPGLPDEFVGCLWGVNSFDQWGVEHGKQMAREILPKMLSGEGDFDASTRGLLAAIRAWRKP